MADLLSPLAESAGAVNTLKKLPDGRLFGDNTDGIGLRRDLVINQGISLEGCRILLLGAGGAVRGVIAALLEEHPEALVIANRTPDKAEKLALLFAGSGKVSFSGFDMLSDRFDLVINGTSAGLSGELPDIREQLLADTVCYDMVYGRGHTAFNRFAESSGARKTYDGLGMLVEQAAESFQLWRGVSPQTAPVLSQLRDFLKET